MKTTIQILAAASCALLCLATASAKAPKTSTPPAKADPVEAYLKAHDKDKNGTIERSEFTGTDADFKKWDKNSDGKLDKGELTEMLAPHKKK